MMFEAWFWNPFCLGIHCGVLCKHYVTLCRLDYVISTSRLMKTGTSFLTSLAKCTEMVCAMDSKTPLVRWCRALPFCIAKKSSRPTALYLLSPSSHTRYLACGMIFFPGACRTEGAQGCSRSACKRPDHPLSRER